MSNVSVIIEERATQMGNFLVGRLLPFRQKRMVGPFIFIDHMGPASFEPHETFDVPLHPHIGLSTLTYLFEGEVLHRDSLGTEQVISPGAVNWMTAGKGIVHSERTPAHLINRSKVLHGLQIWIALPKMHEHDPPSFTHVSANELPQWIEGDVHYRLIAGSAMGYQSAVPVFSPLFLIEISTSVDAEITLADRLYGEIGLYILKGEIEEDGVIHADKRILVASDSLRCAFRMRAGTTVFAFGGEPFSEERYIDWNFVASDRAVIEEAKSRWKTQQFEKIPGETDFVPYPERKL
jgi:redox-sensitive bicupin YhaK (pirin superfamily)